MADPRDMAQKGRKGVARRIAIAFVIFLLIATPVIAQIWGANLWNLLVFEAAKAFVELVSETILEVTLTPIWVFTQINPCVYAPSGNCQSYVIHLIDGGQVEFSMPEDQGIRKVNVKIMEMLQLFYALAIIMIGIYLIFMSGSPQGRVNAKDMFIRVFVGMVLVSLSPAIFQFMLDLVREICDTLIQTALSKSSVTTVSTVVFTFTEAKYCCTMLFFLIVTAIAAPLAAYRYFLVYVMACIFPLTLFMYFTDIPNPLFSMRGIGTRLWKFTILLFMVQILQTLFLCVGLMLANTAYAPTLLDFILMLAAYLGVLLAPMIGMQMMGWIGALVTVAGVRPVTQMTRFLGTWMRSGSVATAVTTSAQLVTIQRLIGDHVGGATSAGGQTVDSPMDRLGEPGSPFAGGRSPFSGGRVGPRSMSSAGAAGMHGASGSSAPTGMPINASTAPVLAGVGAAGAGTTLQRAASAPSAPLSSGAPASSSESAVLAGGGQSAASRASRASAARPPSMGQPQQPRPPSRREPAQESPSMGEESQSPATVVSSASSGTSGGGVSVIREGGTQSGSLGRQIPPSVNATTEAQTPGQAESPGPARGAGVKIQTHGPMKPPVPPMPKVGAPVPSGGEPTARAPTPQETTSNYLGADRQPVSEDELKAKRYAERIEAENRQEEARLQAYNNLLATPKEDKKLGAAAEEARRFESKLSQMASTGAVRDPDNVRRQVLGMADSVGGVNRVFQRDPASLLERAEIAPAVTGQTSEEYIAEKTMMPAIKMGALAPPVVGTPIKIMRFPSSKWDAAVGTGPSAEADRKAILDSLNDKAAANNTLHELNDQIQNGNPSAKEFLRKNQGEILKYFAQEIKPLKAGATTLPPLPAETMKMRYLIELAANDQEFGKAATSLMRDVMAGGDTVNRAALTNNLAAAMRGDPLPSPDGKLKLPPPHSSRVGSPSEKFASVFVAQEVIAKTGLNPGKTAVAWWANNPYYLGSNIGVLNDLEQRQPGAAKLLNERYGITVFGRYGVDALLNQYNQHQLISSGQYKPKHSGIIVNAKSDWNGALYNQADNIKLAQQHGFMFYEAGSTPELAKAMLRHTRMVGAPQYRILGGHGTPDSIQLGDPYAYQQDPRFKGDIRQSPAYLKTSDMVTTKRKFGLFSGIKTEEIPNERAVEIIRGTAPETGRIVTILDSCSTGSFRQSDIGAQTKIRVEGPAPAPAGGLVKPYYPSQILERKKGSIGQKISSLSGGELLAPSAPTPVAKLTVTENPQGGLEFKVSHVSGGLTDALTLEKIPPGIRLTSIYVDGQLVEAPAIPRHLVSPAAQPGGGRASKPGVFRSVGTHMKSSVKGAAQFEAIDLAGDVLRGKKVEAGQVAVNLGVSTAQMAGLGLAQKGVEAGITKMAPKFSAKAGPLAGRALGAGFATYAGYQEGAKATGSYSDGAIGLAESLAKGTVVLPGLGTVAGGLGYVGGLAGQIADEQMKVVQIQSQSFSDDMQRNRFSGMELSLKGWVSGHGNTERYSSAELKTMFPSFADKDIATLRTHSETGFRNPNGWFRWKEDGSGTERMPSNFDILNTSFTRANWGKGPYASEADFLDHNNPNWRYLLSQESGQRWLFERNMPDVYNSRTVQDYVKRLDAGEVKARNLAAIYASNPELSKQIQPGEFWQKSGVTPDVPASQMMQGPGAPPASMAGEQAQPGPEAPPRQQATSAKPGRLRKLAGMSILSGAVLLGGASAEAGQRGGDYRALERQRMVGQQRQRVADEQMRTLRGKTQAYQAKGSFESLRREAEARPTAPQAGQATPAKPSATSQPQAQTPTKMWYTSPAAGASAKEQAAQPKSSIEDTIAKLKAEREALNAKKAELRGELSARERAEHEGRAAAGLEAARKATRERNVEAAKEREAVFEKERLERVERDKRITEHLEAARKATAERNAQAAQQHLEAVQKERAAAVERSKANAEWLEKASAETASRNVEAAKEREAVFEKERLERVERDKRITEHLEAARKATAERNAQAAQQHIEAVEKEHKAAAERAVAREKWLVKSRAETEARNAEAARSSEATFAKERAERTERATANAEWLEKARAETAARNAAAAGEWEKVVEKERAERVERGKAIEGHLKASREATAARNQEAARQHEQALEAERTRNIGQSKRVQEHLEKSKAETEAGNREAAALRDEMVKRERAESLDREKRITEHLEAARKATAERNSEAARQHLAAVEKERIEREERSKAHAAWLEGARAGTDARNREAALNWENSLKEETKRLQEQRLMIEDELRRLRSGGGAQTSQQQQMSEADADAARSGRKARGPAVEVSTPMPGTYSSSVQLTPEQAAYAESLKRNGVSLYDNNEAAAELEMVGRMTGMSPDQALKDASVKAALDKMRRNRDTGIATNETLYNMSDKIIADKMRSEGASSQQVEGILRHVRQIRHDRAEDNHKAILSGLNAAEGSKEREEAVNYLIESTKRRGKTITADDLKSARFVDLSSNEEYMERMRASGIGDISPYAIVVDKADWKGKGDSPGLVDKFMASKGNWGGFNSPPKKGEVVGLNIISGEILEKGSQATIGSDTERTVVHEAAHEKFRVDATMSTLRKEALEAATRKELDERVKAAGITDEKEIERLRKHIMKRREVEFRMINEMNSYFAAEASVEGGFRGSENVRKILRDSYIEAYGKDLTVEEKKRLKDSIYNAIDGLEKIRGKVDNETMSNILKTSYTIEGLSSLAKMDARMVDEYIGRAQTRDDAIDLLKKGKAQDAADRLQVYARKGSGVEATPEGVAAELKRSTLREAKARLKDGDTGGAQELLDKLGAKDVKDLESKTTILGIDVTPSRLKAATADSISGGPLPQSQTKWEPKPPARAPEAPEPTPEEIREAQKREESLDKARRKAMENLEADLDRWRLLVAMERQEAARKKAEEMQREEDALKKAVEGERRMEEQDSSIYTQLEAVVARHQAMITEIQRRGGDTGGLEAGASRLTASLNQREYRKLAAEISEIGAKIRIAYFGSLNSEAASGTVAIMPPPPLAPDVKPQPSASQATNTRHTVEALKGIEVVGTDGSKSTVLGMDDKGRIVLKGSGPGFDDNGYKSVPPEEISGLTTTPKSDEELKRLMDSTQGGQAEKDVEYELVQCSNPNCGKWFRRPKTEVAKK